MQIERLKKIIEELPESEAKTLLFQVMCQVALWRETDYPETQFIRTIEKMYELVLKLPKEQSEMMENEMQKVHIVFGDSTAGSLKLALREMEVEPVEKVLSFWEMFSIGPVWMLHKKIGQAARLDWMKQIYHNEQEDFQHAFHKSMDQMSAIPEDVPIIIWVAENAHEQTGLRFVLHALSNKSNEITVINATKAYEEHFNRPDSKYTVLHTGEISSAQLQVIYEQGAGQILSEHERKEYENEWLALAETKGTLRIWRKEKIKSVREDYYDQYMMNLAKKLQIEREREQESEEFMKSARLIGEALGHLDQCVGDVFLEYRLRKLIEKGIFEMQGNLNGLRFYSVRLVNPFH